MTPQESLENLELAYEMFSQHLPTSSMIRLQAASLLAQRRRVRDLSEDPAVTVDLPMYHREAVERYGSHSDIAIQLEMDMALHDILGERPALGYEQMQHLMFSEADPLPVTHSYMRLKYASEFIVILFRAEKHQWLQDNAKRTLEISLSHLGDDTIMHNFATAAERALRSCEESENWADFLKLCDFVLLQSEIKDPKHRELRIRFLEHRVTALRKLGEPDELAKLLREITEIKYSDPARRSRYAED
jgi:hypothetical protein